MNNGINCSNIILIGFMGTGKTSVGESLAKQLSFRFCDTDRMLEQKAGDSISHIFKMRGEAYFRCQEAKLLQELRLDLRHTVLSTGGGLPLRKENVELIRAIGFVVLLKASKETVLKRLSGDRTRPLLQGENPAAAVEKLLNERTPLYEKAAHMVVITDECSVEEVISQIREAYRKAEGNAYENCSD